MLYTFIEIKEIENGEKGLFAKQEIKKGKIVWRLDTNEKKLTHEERDNLPPQLQKLAFQYKDKFIVVHDGSEYMNHSCESNTWWKSDEILSAKRDIKEGEEITYDYATADIGDWIASWDCTCGAENCRKKITGKDCLSGEFQERYKGHLPSWTLEYIFKTKLFETIKHIHLACNQLSRQIFGGYLQNSGNMGVFCQTEEEYEKFTKLRKILTEPSNNPDQKYYKLHEPIVISSEDEIPETTYTHLYIRKPDPTSYGEYLGDVDFVVEDEEYKELKEKVEKGEVKSAEIYDRPGWDNIQLTDPNIDAVAYVSTMEMAKRVRIKF